MRGVMLAVAAAAIAIPAAAQDEAAEVMLQVRYALGGERLAQIRTLSVEGPFARDMGPRRVEGEAALTLQLPDRMHRREDVELMGGMSMERVSAVAGDTAWEDMQSRGGLGRGGMMMIRQGPPGQELNAEAVERARLRRIRAELHRYLLAFLGGGPLQPSYVGVAEAPDGRADVLEVKHDGGGTVRLFVDQVTHMPLMLQYQEVRPVVNMMRGEAEGRGPGGPVGRGGSPAAGGRGGQRPDPEEIRRRMESMPPPAPSTVSLFLGDYKEVDGVMVPHRLTQAVDGKTVEEWTLEKVRIDPDVESGLFERK